MGQAHSTIIQFDGTRQRPPAASPAAEPTTAVGFQIYENGGDGVLCEGQKLVGPGLTCQQAEYHAMFEAVRAATQVAVSTVPAHVQGDSQTVLKCVNPAVRDSPSHPLSQRYVSEIRRQLAYFDRVEYTYVGRGGTARADTLADQAVEQSASDV